MEFRLGNNCLYYEIEGNGHPLVVLHAMGTNHQSMKKWLEPVFITKRGFKRIYVDLPWHGHSVCNDIVSTEGIRQLLSAFITEFLGEQHYSIIGHSFGGYIAQGLICDKLSGLCLLAPATHNKVRNVPTKTVRNLNENSLNKVSAEIRTAFETLMVYQTAENLQLFLEEVQPGRLQADREFLASNWRESGYFLKEDPLVNPYSGHSIIIAGRLDSICGYKDYYKLSENLPNSTLAILQAGHLIAIEKRETVQFLVSDWLDHIL